MSEQVTVYREVEDIYNPDPDATIEVRIEVEFSVQPAEPDVGIFRAFAEDVWVTETDSDLFDVDQAQAWLDANYTKHNDREAVYAWDKIGEAAAEADDYRRDRRRGRGGW